MNNKSIWKFTIKRDNSNELYFGFTFADTEEEAKSNIMESMTSDEYRKNMKIISISKVPDGIRVCMVGGARGIVPLRNTINAVNKIKEEVKSIEKSIKI